MRRLRSAFAGPDGVAVQAIEDLGGGWDVIVAAGWGNDIWKALVFGGARTGGPSIGCTPSRPRAPAVP